MKKIKVGQKITVSKTITDKDINAFAEITGDLADIHLNEGVAEATPIGGRIAHGMLIAGIMASALAKLPGIVIQTSQSLRFLKPARIGDTVTATIQVMERISANDGYWLMTECKNTKGDILVIGEARVKILENPLG